MIEKLIRGIRKHQRLAVFILLIFVALAFGITGTMLTVLRKKEPEAILGKILDREITQPEFFDVKIRCKVWASLYIRQSGFLPADFPFNMAEHKKFILFQENRLINAISSSEEDYIPPGEEYYDNLARAILVLRTLAECAGIKVTPKEVREHIQRYSFLKTPQGEFDVRHYRMVVRQYIGISPSAFEKTAKEFLQIHKYANLVLGSISPTLEDIYQKYLHNNEEIKIRCVAFKPDDFRDQVKIKSPEEIEDFFRNNRDNYRVPEKIQIEYVLADYDLLKKAVRESTPEELKDYYEKHKDSFKITGPNIPDEGVSIYKSFAKVKEAVKSLWQEEEAHVLAVENIMEAGEKIKRLLVRDKPVDLEAIAREFSFKYGSTGFFSQDRVSEIEKEVGTSEPFTRQVFTYPEKEISHHLSTDKGFIIFRVLKKKPARTLEFTMDLKERVIKDLKEMKVKELVRKKADELAKEILNKVSEELKTIEPRLGGADSEKEKLTKGIREKWFKHIVAEQGLEPVETLYFKRRDSIPELFENTFQFNEKVFELSEGNFKVISDTIKSRTRKEDHEIYYLSQVMARRLPTGDDYETQKARLESQVNMEAFEEFFDRWREEIKIQADKLKPKKATD